MSETHYQYAQNQVKAEKNSFFTFVFRYINEVHWLEQWDTEWIRFDTSDGHTRGMMVPRIPGKDYDLVYASDLLPMKLLKESGAYSYYDVDRDLLQKEKNEFLTARDKATLAILYHEPINTFLFISGGEVTEMIPEESESMLTSFIFNPS